MSKTVGIAIAAAALLGLGFLLTRLGLLNGPRPDNLGVQGGRLAPCPDTPNCVSTQAQDEVHGMPPLPMGMPIEQARDRLLDIVEQMPRTKIITQERTYIHVEFRTLVMNFVDDVEFYLDEQTGLIHFRSASRLGGADGGLNRRRMEAISSSYIAG